MNKKQFCNIIDRRCIHIKAILFAKSKEYPPDIDILHNFRLEAVMVERTNELY